MQSNPNLLAQQIFEIFQGDTKALPLKAVYQGTFLPVDLTNCAEITVMLPLAAGGYTALKLSAGQVEIISPAVLGMMNVPGNAAVSATFQPGTLQDIFALITTGGGTPINVTAGLANGTTYVITSLGTTTDLQWQALGFPEDETPAVGDVFTCNSATPGAGTGVVQTLASNVTVPFRKCFSVFE